MLLYGEQTLDASSDELLSRGSHDLRESSELTVCHIVHLELLGSAFLTSQAGVFARVTSSIAWAFTLLRRRVHSSAPGGLLSGSTGSAYHKKSLVSKFALEIVALI